MDAPVVGIIMGSDSDWPTMRDAGELLKDFKVGVEAKVVSAHRTPHVMVDYAESAAERGIKMIIAGAGGAAVNAGGVGVEPQNHLRSAARHMVGEAGCEGLGTHRMTAVTMGMVNRDRTVVTATQPASRLTGRR